MTSNTLSPDRERKIRALFDEYIEMYASRDDRLTTHFSPNFSGYTGSGDFLVKDSAQWVDITRLDFSQVPERIRIEMLDISLQDLSDDVVAVTAFFHIHLPSCNPVLAREVARLVLIFRLEGEDWKIVHSGISIPYRRAGDGEVYPLTSLQERNSELQALVEERTRALNESQALYRLLTEDTRDVLWRTDAQLHITYISPADERLRGFKADEVLGHHVFEMFTPEGVATVQKMMAHRQLSFEAGAEVGFMRFEVEHKCKDGHLVWGEVLSKPERNAQGTIVGYHGITREITERRNLEAKVRELAFHDTLTHLANRRLMEDLVAQTIASSKRSHRYGALLFLDLDNFKSLNDTHGHAAGDLLLMEVASRLQTAVRRVDTVARFGGDEFVVLLRDLSTDGAEARAQAGAIAEKVRASLAEPYVLHVTPSDPASALVEHRCTASIGVAVFNGRQGSLDEMLDQADSAMYRAKEEGRNRVCFHEDAGN